MDFGRSASIQQAVDEIANLDNEYDRLKYIFLAAGQGLQRELALTMPGQIHDLIDTNLTGPLKLLGEILLWQRALGEPFHLVTVASTSAWKRRSDETVYGATMAARAQMARDFHQELLRDLPGSKSTLVLPGGMKTGFWDGTGVDTSKFMEPAEVAALIMAEVTAQAEPWLELQIERDGEGKPKLEYGPRLPN